MHARGALALGLTAYNIPIEAPHKMSEARGLRSYLVNCGLRTLYQRAPRMGRPS